MSRIIIQPKKLQDPREVFLQDLTDGYLMGEDFTDDELRQDGHAARDYESSDYLARH